MRESDLHRRAKEVIKNAKQIRLPDLFAWRISDHIEIGTKYRNPQLVQPTEINPPLDGLSYNVFGQTDLTIITSLMEKPYFGFKPDVIINTSSGYIGFEIVVTNKVSKEKLGKIKSNNLSVIEIDLRSVKSDISDLDLSHLMLFEVVGKTWLHLGNLEEEFNKVTEEVKRFERKQNLGKGFLSTFFDSWFLGEDHPSLPSGWKELDGKERRPVVLETRFPNRPEYFVEGCPEAFYKAKSCDLNLDYCKQCKYHKYTAEDLSHIVCSKVFWTSSLSKSK